MPSPAELTTTDVGRALDVLRAGGLVAIPTETVYGLAADAERPAAVRRIFEIKGRPTGHPLIVHLADVGSIDGWCESITEPIERLASACWPGPLTMLVPRGPRVRDEVTGGLPSVGLRVPSHPLTAELLRRFGGGLAAPSANRFGRVSPTRAEHVITDLGDLLEPGRDLVLDGGPCPVGVESTIVDLTSDPPQVLRTGAIDAETVERLLARPVTGARGPSRTSGMLAAHYAPACEVVLCGSRPDAEREVTALHAAGRRADLLDRTDDLVVAARELYADLRAADLEGLDAVVVVLPPASGLGHALRDRLTKAAAGSHRGGPSRVD